jgi:creatinine amidohydrolase
VKAFARFIPLLAGIALLSESSRAEEPARIEIEALTSSEVGSLLAAGFTTIIVPSGGTEQNGPHLVLGKHNIVVRHAAGEIARRLGHALVAPVIAYVPEGKIDPPEGHMLYPGTISLPEPVFAALLEATARSFIAEGFRAILFLGDSGGNQPAQAAVAKRLAAEFGPEGVRVIALDDYYAANGQVAWLETQGETQATIGRHAGIRETSELLAIAPDMVRTEFLQPGQIGPGTGSDGAPSRASAERGRHLLELKIAAGLAQARRELGINN